MRVSDDLNKPKLHAGDLDGREITLTIQRVEPRGAVKMDDEAIDKPVLFFEETTKFFPINVTNERVCQLQLGNSMAKWPGKKITLYPTTTEIAKASAERYGCIILRERGKMATVPCIRVKPSMPTTIRTSDAPDPDFQP
jgi:hypothetical protein